jgi:hypothetical protein
MMRAPFSSGALNLIDEARAIREHEKIVITNALDERSKEVVPKNHPALFIDATMRIDNFKYSVCYAAGRRPIKENHLFLPIALASLKEKTRVPEWFAATSAQLVAYYNYQAHAVWLLRVQHLRELPTVTSNRVKEYIPCLNNKVYGYLLGYHEIERTTVAEIEVTDEKHQLAVALSQSLYF